jgi:hypothetical protein
MTGRGRLAAASDQQTRGRASMFSLVIITGRQSAQSRHQPSLRPSAVPCSQGANRRLGSVASTKAKMGSIGFGVVGPKHPGSSFAARCFSVRLSPSRERFPARRRRPLGRIDRSLPWGELPSRSSTPGDVAAIRCRGDNPPKASRRAPPEVSTGFRWARPLDRRGAFDEKQGRHAGHCCRGLRWAAGHLGSPTRARGHCRCRSPTCAYSE